MCYMGKTVREWVKAAERSTSVYLPADYWNKLRQIARQEDRSVSYLIRKAVEPIIEQFEPGSEP